MDDSRAARLAENEVFYRDLNENLVGLGRGRLDSLTILCECGDQGCSERINVSKAMYEEVRVDAACFLVKTGHEQPEIETVEVRHDSVTVVRKIGVGAIVANLHPPPG